MPDGEKAATKPAPLTQFGRWLQMLGPGVAVAATGVGAGDMVAAAVAGSRYGIVLLWAALVGAVIKFAMNEGLARWQLATGTTLLEGWTRHLGRWVSAVFLVYLLVWSFIVAGALIAACGLAAHAFFGGLSVAWWGVIHSVTALALVSLGRYQLFESLMKFFIALMFVVLLTCAFLVRPEWPDLLRYAVVPAIPPGSGAFILGIIGGVGGSVTLLNYSYWIREKQWRQQSDHRKVKIDVGVAYGLTGLFGIAVMIIAAGVHPREMTGNGMVLAVADSLQAIVGTTGRWVFLAGFWGAVFSSMLGVWQGVPYIFADFLRCWRGSSGEVDTRSRSYRVYLLYLALPPLLLLLINRPVWIVVIYSVAGAMFMPFLAGTLLYLNNRRQLAGDLRNSVWANLLLVAALLLFGYLCWEAIAAFF